MLSSSSNDCSGCSLTLWVVFTISFFLMRSVPGGPFDSDRRLEPEIEQNMLRRYHLDEPLWQQYVRELVERTSAAISATASSCSDYTVNGVIAEGLPISAALGFLALAFALSLGLVAGITSAVAPRVGCRRHADVAGHDRHRRAQFRRRRHLRSCCSCS